MQRLICTDSMERAEYIRKNKAQRRPMLRRVAILAAALTEALFLALAPAEIRANEPQNPQQNKSMQQGRVQQRNNSRPVARYGIRVLASYPHDDNSYTQGLFFHNGTLYESAGQYGGSSFRRVDVKSGKISRIQYFESRYFIEGSCAIGDKAYLLTWREHKCFIYDIANFRPLGEMRLSTEGWGATTDGKSLIISDGSDKLYFLNPDTFMADSVKSVTLKGKPLSYLNELEMINGDIWANVYCENYIVIIDPASGEVKGVVDCNNLLPSALRTRKTDVLNGIAYNPKDKSLYLTGKNWPRIFKVTTYKK